MACYNEVAEFSLGGLSSPIANQTGSCAVTDILSKHIVAVKNGDSDAFADIAEALKSRIYSLISSFSISANEREDVYQECLIALYDAVIAYDEAGSAGFTSYATVCLRNRIISSVRRLNRKKNLSMTNYIPLDSPGEDDGAGYPADNIYPHTRDPEDQFLEKESYESLLSFADSVLSPLEKQIFDLYILGFSYHEISDALEKPVKAVDNAVYRIRTKLRSEMNAPPLNDR